MVQMAVVVAVVMVAVVTTVMAVAMAGVMAVVMVAVVMVVVMMVVVVTIVMEGVMAVAMAVAAADPVPELLQWRAGILPLPLLPLLSVLLLLSLLSLLSVLVLMLLELLLRLALEPGLPCGRARCLALSGPVVRNWAGGRRPGWGCRWPLRSKETLAAVPGPAGSGGRHGPGAPSARSPRRSPPLRERPGRGAGPAPAAPAVR